jgi:hypothetical protein
MDTTMLKPVLLPGRSAPSVPRAAIVNGAPVTILGDQRAFLMLDGHEPGAELVLPDDPVFGSVGKPKSIEKIVRAHDSARELLGRVTLGVVLDVCPKYERTEPHDAACPRCNGTREVVCRECGRHGAECDLCTGRGTVRTRPEESRPTFFALGGPHDSRLMWFDTRLPSVLLRLLPYLDHCEASRSKGMIELRGSEWRFWQAETTDLDPEQVAAAIPFPLPVADEGTA